MARILILGGGFGGLIAAEHLSKKLKGEHRITLVSPSNGFTFFPALVRLVFEDCEPDDISFSLTKKLDKLNVRFVQGEVIDINPDARKVKVVGEDIDGAIHYDYLIIATGRRLATEKVRGYFDHAHHLLGVDAAMRFSDAVRFFKKGEIIVGLSPQSYLPVAVCETAFAIARRFKDQIDKGDITVSVVFPESVSDVFGGADLGDELREAFDKHGILQTSSFPIVEVTKSHVVSERGAKIPYDLLMLLPPFRGAAFLDKLGVSDEHGFLVTDEFMKVSGLENIFAVGDIVELPGPKLAYAAVEQAHVASANIVAELSDEEPSERYYHDIAAIIDAGGSESLYLHYGVWDDSLYKLKKGKIWKWTKRVHDRLWQAAHEG